MHKSRERDNKFFKFFSAADPLKFIAMDIPGPFKKSAKNHRYVLYIADRLTELCLTVPLKSTTAAAVTQAFLENWEYPYQNPLYTLTDNGSQFWSKFFATVCSMLCIKHVTAMAYHPQTNGQAEQFNKALVECLRNYFAEH